MSIDEKINQINPDAYYSASEIVKNKWLWMKTVLTLTAFLRSEEGKRLLKPLIINRGAVVRYQVKGSALIELVRALDSGDIQIKHV
jgi:hypothetical protein